jgi:hypothetical protein
MPYPIFPVSPLPANTDRTKFWKTDDVTYDSGAYQAMTTFTRPLFRWSIPWQNVTEIKQGALATFVDSVKGKTYPFLMKDPYEYQVNSVLAVRSGVTNGATLQLYDTRSFFVIADTTTISSLYSLQSGYVSLGAHFDYNQDTGILTVNTKAPEDVWAARSMEYFRKCVFAEDYRDTSVIWNIFNLTLAINEIV